MTTSAKEPETTPEPETTQPPATFTQADLDRVAAKARQQGREAALRDLRAAEQDKTIETTEGQSGELETTKQRLERAEAAMLSHVEGLKSGIPAPVLSLLEGMEVSAQLKWLSENSSSFTAPTTADSARTPKGIPPTPEAKKGRLPDNRAERAAPIRSYL